MKPLFCLLLTLSLCPAISSQAQKNAPAKYGAISEKDFTLTQAFDTGTAAVIIADIGSTSFEGNAKGDVTMVFKWYRRVKVLNKNGFDMADVSIPLYFSGSDEERVADLKGHTYNLEDGKI